MFKKAAIAPVIASLIMAMAMPVFAKNPNANGNANDNTNVKTNLTNAPKGRPQLNVACIQTAIEKRDTAILAAVDAYNTTIKTALQTRKDALKAAWALSDVKARRTATKVAWEAFRAASRKANKDKKSAVRGAWKQFLADRKPCGAAGASEDAGQGTDANL